MEERSRIYALARRNHWRCLSHTVEVHEPWPKPHQIREVRAKHVCNPLRHGYYTVVSCWSAERIGFTHEEAAPWTVTAPDTSPSNSASRRARPSPRVEAPRVAPERADCTAHRVG